MKIGVPTGLATDYIGNLYLDMGEIQKAEPFIKEGKLQSVPGQADPAKNGLPLSQELL